MCFLHCKAQNYEGNDGQGIKQPGGETEEVYETSYVTGYQHQQADDGLKVTFKIIYSREYVPYIVIQASRLRI